jgi:hypothetical protein
LPVHRLTDPQIFYPVSESRQFTRVDAGRVFSAAPALLEQDRNKPGNSPESISEVTLNPSKIERIGRGYREQVLQPAEVRIPHPQLVAFEYDKLHNKQELAECAEKFMDRIAAEDAMDHTRARAAIDRVVKSTRRIQPETSKFEFHFRDVVVSRETTGRTGRGKAAPGRRYGAADTSRAKGDVKIPTKVNC